MSADGQLVFRKVPGKYVLGYWYIRGLAAPIRMALTAAGVDFVDESSNYALDKLPDGSWSREKWTASYSYMEKEVHPFPNLPYLVLPTGEVFVETRAITAHIARTFGLGGTTELERFRNDEINDFMSDFRGECSPMFYGNLEGLKAAFFADVLPYYLLGLERRLEQFQTPFFGGGSATTADFNVCDFTFTMLQFSAENGGAARDRFFDKYPLLSAHYDKVRSLPALAPYFASPSATLSANNWMAQWPGFPPK